MKLGKAVKSLANLHRAAKSSRAEARQIASKHDNRKQLLQTIATDDEVFAGLDAFMKKAQKIADGKEGGMQEANIALSEAQKTLVPLKQVEAKNKKLISRYK